MRYGNAFYFYDWYKYLKDMNKFSAFRTKCKEDSLGKRPNGKKKVRQAEPDAKLVKAIILEVVVKKDYKVCGSDGIVSAYELSSNEGGEVIGDLLQSVSNAIANVGTALLENMKAEQDMQLVQSLDTPDRKMYAKEQLALRMEETRDKRRRIELDSAKQQQQNE
jgi:hypothetical protein